MTASLRPFVFRALAVVLAPLAFVLAAEIVLRVAGYGSPTEFFLPIEGRAVETTNPRFGDRFFGPRLARSPVLQTLEVEKSANEVRIFVLGGSAAMGTPDASFGLAPILEVLLEKSYPEIEFTVVNAAMAAINSHVAVEIARECAARRPDLFLVYLGNNEVVGPFGPGSVFGRFSPSPTLVRVLTWLPRLRLAQLLDAGLGRWTGGGAEPSEWRGLEMFAGNRVPFDDPRLEGVYRHLDRNLTTIARLARSAGAEAVFATVATNLKDSPPFSGGEDELLEPELRRRLATLRERALAALRNADPAAAATALRAASALDPAAGDTRFLLGTALLSIEPSEARAQLVQARDLDELRFRADSRINQVIREAGAREGAVVLDAERLLESSPETAGRPLGRELFYEHVHLNFRGNYRLARAFQDAIGDFLPAREPGPAPSPEEVAEILALSATDVWRMHSMIERMMRRPPFTGQLLHAERAALRAEEIRRLRAAAVSARTETEERYRRAVAARPDDLDLIARNAQRLAALGRPADAERHWRRLLESIPSSRPWRTGLGFALADQGRLEEALAELERVRRLYPELPEPLSNLATVLERLGRMEEAERRCREALELQPDFEPASLNLAGILEATGRAAAAERLYRRSSEQHPDSGQPALRLASLYDRAGRVREAEEWYGRAIRRDASLALAHNNLGFLLERQGRLEEAARAYLRAVEEDPALALGYFNLADLLLQSGQGEEAAALYRSGLAFEPGNLQARENLARAESL